MVGDSLHISLELPLRPLVTNSGCRTDHCRELGPNIRKQTGIDDPIAKPLSLLSAPCGYTLPWMKAQIVDRLKLRQLADRCLGVGE